MNNKFYIDRTYYTMDDMLLHGIVTETELEDLNIGNTINPFNTRLSRVIAEWTAQNATSYTAFDKDEMNILYCTYIYPRFKQCLIGYIDKNIGETPSESEEEELYRKFNIKLLNNMRTTYDEYKLLIDTLDTEKTNLMNAVKTQTKINDTPQTTTSEGVTSYDDTYNSTVTTNYSDGATKIARIAEIENLIKDYYEK